MKKRKKKKRIEGQKKEVVHGLALPADRLRATRGARNPNLQVVTTHASHICCHR